MNDIYTTPKSNLVSGTAIADGKRSGWVWAIFIFYLLSLVITIVSFYLIFSGLLPMPPEQKQYFDDLGLVRWSILVIATLLSFAAALSLFMLRKITLKIWLATILFGVISTLSSLLDSSWMQIMNASSGIGMVFGYAVKIAIYFYARRLAASGMLK